MRQRHPSHVSLGHPLEPHHVVHHRAGGAVTVQPTEAQSELTISVHVCEILGVAVLVDAVVRDFSRVGVNGGVAIVAVGTASKIGVVAVPVFIKKVDAITVLVDGVAHQVCRNRVDRNIVVIAGLGFLKTITIDVGGR